MILMHYIYSSHKLPCRTHTPPTLMYEYQSTSHRLHTKIYHMPHNPHSRPPTYLHHKWEIDLSQCRNLWGWYPTQNFAGKVWAVSKWGSGSWVLICSGRPIRWMGRLISGKTTQLQKQPSNRSSWARTIKERTTKSINRDIPEATKVSYP